MNDIEKVIEKFIYLGNGAPIHNVLYGMDRKEKREMFLLAANALEKQLNNGWISVCERMPEEGTKVLVVSKNDSPIYCVAIMINGELRVTWNHDRFEHIKIIAWQPLPEPYKEIEN